jgi:hypothetical protein
MQTGNSDHLFPHKSLAEMMTVPKMILMTIDGNQHVGLLRKTASHTAPALRRMRMTWMRTTPTGTQKCKMMKETGGQLQRKILRVFGAVHKMILMAMPRPTKAVVCPTEITVLRMIAERHSLVAVDLQTDFGTVMMTELQNHRSKGKNPTVMVKPSVRVGT